MYCGSDNVVKLTDVSFMSNHAQAGNGGGVALIGTHRASVEGCLFQGNMGIKGGEIYSKVSFGAVLTVHNCVFDTNIARTSSTQLNPS